MEDLTGRTFSRLKVIERDYSRKHKSAEYYKCECRCGNNNYITTAKELLAGKGSCGCIRKIKGFNDYKTEGETTIIYLERKNGEILEALIDTDDLDRLIKHNYSWHAIWKEDTKSYYVRTSVYEVSEIGKRICIMLYLHRLLTDTTDPDIRVDHENYDTLDNRKNNLRITNDDKNTKNRSSKNSNNKSGFRNVFWDSTDRRWLVTLQVDKKSRCFGRFKLEDLDKAGALAEKMRQEIYGEFAGKS